MSKQLLLVTPLIIMLFFSCDIDQTKETELPSVDVEATYGQLPEYEIDWADVNVGTRTKKITVPKVVLVTEEIEIEVPYIDVEMPGEEEKEERMIAVEVEVVKEAHRIDIKEVYAVGNRLYVISELEPTGQKLGDETMRISDQIRINAPDLDVKHYIIGRRPERNFNKQYTYLSDRDAIASKLSKGKQIFKK